MVGSQMGSPSRCIGFPPWDNAGGDDAAHFSLSGGAMMRQPPKPQRQYPHHIEFSAAKRQGYVATRQLRVQVLYLYKGRCFVCGIEEWRYKQALQMHRIVAGKDGGLYVLNNVIPVCRKCHRQVEGLGWDTLGKIQSELTKWIEEKK